MYGLYEFRKSLFSHIGRREAPREAARNGEQGGAAGAPGRARGCVPDQARGCAPVGARKPSSSSACPVITPPRISRATASSSATCGLVRL